MGAAIRGFMRSSWKSTAALYLDAALAEPGEGMAGVIEIMSGLVRRWRGSGGAGAGGQRAWRAPIRDGRARGMRAEKTTWRQAPGGQGSGRRCTEVHQSDRAMRGAPADVMKIGNTRDHARGGLKKFIAFSVNICLLSAPFLNGA
jgi:hypothetical protein